MEAKLRLITLLAGLLFCLPLDRAVAAEERLDGEWFARLFTEIVAQESPWPAADLNISNVTSRPSGLSVGGGQISHRLLAAPRPLRLGRQYLTVQILCDNNPRGEVQISGDVGLFGNVVCAGRQLKRNTILTEADLVTVRRDLTMLGADALRHSEQAVGQRLTTSLQAGALLYANLLAAAPMVKRGDLVTIVARSRAIEITTPGQARMAGAKGELIKVKNLASRRELYATVLDSATVAVDF